MTTKRTEAHPEEVADVDAKVFDLLKSLQADYDRAHAHWKRAKEKAAALKKDADECAANLFAYVRKLGEPLPMFEGGENGDLKDDEGEP
jgi:hypothetical protein